MSPVDLELKAQLRKFSLKESCIKINISKKCVHEIKRGGGGKEGRPFVFPTAAIRNGGIAFLGEGETIMLSFSPFGSFFLCCGNSTDAHFYLL